jgi:hypothetical protein
MLSEAFPAAQRRTLNRLPLPAAVVSKLAHGLEMPKPTRPSVGVRTPYAPAQSETLVGANV